MRAQRIPDERMQCRFRNPRAFERVGVFFFSSSAMMVEDDVGPGYGLARARHAELEFIARECQRRGAVAVGGVARNGRQHVNADAQLALAVGIVGLVENGLDDGLSSSAKEDRDDGRRGLLCAEAVVVARKGNGRTQKLLIVVDALRGRPSGTAETAPTDSASCPVRRDFCPCRCPATSYCACPSR